MKKPTLTIFPEFKKWEASSPTQQISPTQLIDIAYQSPDYFPPGKGWHYSNTNYLLAGLIVEKVTHESLIQVYQERFLTPLQLHHTFYSDHFYPTSVEQQLAHAYSKDQDITNFNAGFIGSAGSILMNSQDLLNWIQALFTPGKVLNQNSLKQFESTVKVPLQSPRPSSSRYGLGIFSMTAPHLGTLWWYTGVINGYTSIFVWAPSQHKIIVAQVASWPEDNFAVLFPNQALIQKTLKEPL